jgi:hypothetical protein
MGLIILRSKRKLICFEARLTRGERSFFVAQKSDSVISKGNHFAQLHLGGENPRRDRKIRGVWGQVKDSTYRKEWVPFPGVPESWKHFQRGGFPLDD